MVIIKMSLSVIMAVVVRTDTRQKIKPDSRNSNYQLIEKFQMGFHKDGRLRDSQLYIILENTVRPFNLQLGKHVYFVSKNNKPYKTHSSYNYTEPTVSCYIM